MEPPGLAQNVTLVTAGPALSESRAEEDAELLTSPSDSATQNDYTSWRRSPPLRSPPLYRERPRDALLKPVIRRFSNLDWQQILKQPPVGGPPVLLYSFHLVDPASAGSEPGAADHQDNVVFDRARDEPVKILFRSPILAEEIQEVTGIPIPRHWAMMKSPFKILVQFWEEIKQRLTHLRSEENRLNALEAATLAQSVTSTAEPEEARNREAEGVLSHGQAGPRLLVHVQDTRGNGLDSLHRIRFAVLHLQALIDFGETAFRRILEVRAKAQDGSLQSIAFDDLSHLFRPGDILFSDDGGQPQLYQAYFVTGGQPRLRGPTKAERDNQRVVVVSRRRRSRSPPARRAWYDAASQSSSSDDGTSPLQGVMAGTWTPFVVDCLYFDIDGTGVGATTQPKKITRYVGEKNILDLPIYPVRYLKNSDALLKRLEERGRKFVLCEGHKRYEGQTFDDHGRSSRQRLQGEVYIDQEEYSRSRARYFRSRLGRFRRTNPVLAEIEDPSDTPNRFHVHLDHEVDQFMSDTFLAAASELQDIISREAVLELPDYLRLMGHRVSAFSFRSRSWVNLEIDHVEEIDKSEAARESGFRDLCIPTKHRRLLISLVNNHTSHHGNFDPGEGAAPKPSTQLDLVRGKGLGLIVLLHGPPGTGKTSTAETIAAHTGRPLYAITCGDLGEEVSTIENRLDVHSKRADRWGCVLLLDEADVFLMRRDWKDTKRNAMVSIFLRTLEYFSGILFLTTNRVGVIDEAFKSRMHVSLRYPKVKLNPTLDIWRNMLDRIERDNEHQDIKVVFDRDDLMEFAETHYEHHSEMRSTWNGRQIRNAFQTAIALGQYERLAKMQKKGLTPEEAFNSGKKKWRMVELTRKNLGTIADTAHDFDKYMKSVHRGSDGELAKAEDLRNDEFSEPDEPPVRRTFLSPQPASRPKKAASPSWGSETGGSAKTRGKRPQKKLDDESDSSPDFVESENGPRTNKTQSIDDSDQSS